MSNRFYRLYLFLQSRKWLIPLGILSILLTSGFVLWNTNLEEDITKVLPANEEIKKFNEGFLDSELSNRLIIHLYAEDAIFADSLTQFCGLFVDSLLNSASKDLIKGVTHKMDPSLYQDLSNTIIDNLPLFLKAEHYQEIENRLSDEVIQERVLGSYKALNSPASFAFKKIARKDPLGISNLVFEELTNFQLDDNFELYNNYLVTKDKKHLLFFISPSGSALESSSSAKLINSVSQIGDYYSQRFQNCTFEYFGGSAIGLANASRIRKDVTLTVSIALFALFLLITYYYRDWRVQFYILAPVVIGGALAIAILGILKSTLSIIAIGVGSVLIGISLDFSIHLFTHFRKTKDIVQVYKDVSLPIVLSAITTSSAFLCLCFVRSEAMQDLGIFAALSIFCSAILALILQPHFFSNKTAQAHTDTFIDRIARFPYEKQKWLVGLLFLAFIILAFKAKDVSFEQDLNKINYMPEALITAEEHINEISDASKRGIYLINFGDDLNDALNKGAKLIPQLEKLKSEGKIESFTSPNQLITSEQDQQRKIDQWNQFWSDEKKQNVQTDIIKHTAALKFKPSAFSPFYEVLDKDYNTIHPKELDEATGHLLTDYFTEKPGSATSNTMVRLNPDQKKYIHEAFGNQTDVSIIDKEYLVHQFVETLKTDFSKLVWISLFVVFLTLHFVYGRPELALVAFLPIVFSWTITLGLMNIFAIKFNIVNIIITSFIFGLGIDYSIFIMRGLQQKYRNGINNLDSYKASILLSSLTTLIGIGVLLFAQHPALKSIASISLIGIFSVLLVSFTIQPMLYRWLTEKDGKPRKHPLTILNMGKTLWVYVSLLSGCLVLSVVVLILLLLFFIPMRIRKRFLHQCIYYASKLYLRLSFLNRYKVLNPFKEDFSKQSIIVANHRSLIDTPMFFSLTPKLLIVTNDWVRSSPFYRLVCYMADFHTISQGVDNLMENLEGPIRDGYSIAIFPEGTRSFNEKMLRFRKGAFLLAENLKMDIVPVFFHGTKDFLGKRNFWGRANDITLHIDKRISYEDKKFGNDYSSYTKNFSKWFKERYSEIRANNETVHYHRDSVLYNYIYKGPVTEWYTKVKTKLDNDYVDFDKLIDADARVYDLGCGLGYMTYYLSLSQPKRIITGVDYDEDKIIVAKNCAIKSENVNFIQSDITTFAFEKADVFILSDVVHYLPKGQQYQLLENCYKFLNPNGKIIVRDGDGDLSERHKGTKLTEIISTKLGFNKTKNALSFISGKELKEWASQKSLAFHQIDETKFTSNVIFVMEKEM